MGKQSLSVELLRRRVQEAYGSSTPSINELVDGLRVRYPEYARHKSQVFNRMVKQALDCKRKSNRNDEDGITSRKKTKLLDDSKEENRRIELQSESEEDISAVATSEDEACILELDLTKSMLRNRYSGSEKPKIMELELVTDNNNKKVDLVMGDKSVNVDGVRFKDLGGMDDVLRELKMDVIIPFYHPDLHLSVGVRPTAGILLHGPPGCGKTTIANAIANEAGVPFYKISAPELVSGVSGASEENIRELFSKANKTAPSIIFIDEIDAIASKREDLQRDMERRIVTQLMICMDATSKGNVLVIGATNRPDALDRALRRPGRFDREITLGVPDEIARTKILRVLTRDVKLEGDFDMVKIAKLTSGFVGADLEALVNKAGNLAVRRIIEARELELCTHTEQDEYWWRKAWTPEEKAKLSIIMPDFEEAVKLVQPSLKREGFTSIPDVKWEDIGGLDRLRRKFYNYMVRRIKDPVEYQKSGLNLETGFLLYGPPGCGKTSIAKAVANEAGANFIHIKGPELLNKYVGESELRLRTIFSCARTCSPCIVFFDEIDALTSERGKEGGWVVERVLSQLLIELDGGDQRKGVYVIGATNRPEVMDRALLRPGRFGKLLYVPLPNLDERGLILKALSKNYLLDAGVDLIAIARTKACENFSGADLSKLMAEAAMVARKRGRSEVKAADFKKVLKKSKPSVSAEVRHYYDQLSKSFKA